MNSGVVFSGYRVPKNLKDFDLAVYLVKGVNSFGEYVRIRNAWEKMLSKNDFEVFLSLMSKHGLKKNNNLLWFALNYDFQFDEFYRIVEKEYPSLAKIREDYKRIVNVLDAMAKRKENSFIVGDVKDGSRAIIRTFFQKRHQNYKNPKNNSSAFVVSEINHLSVIGRKDITLLAINGNHLLRCDHKNEIKTANIIFISEISDGIYLPDWVDINKMIFMADDIVDGTFHVGDYYITFEF